MYCKESPVTEYLLVAASTLSLSSAYKTSSFFQKLARYPHVFFQLQSFLWEGPLTVKVRKNIIDQILGCISLYIEMRAHLGEINKLYK